MKADGSPHNAVGKSVKRCSGMGISTAVPVSSKVGPCMSMNGIAI